MTAVASYDKLCCPRPVWAGHIVIEYGSSSDRVTYGAPCEHPPGSRLVAPLAALAQTFDVLVSQAKQMNMTQHGCSLRDWGMPNIPFVTLFLFMT